ncbi:hypothetical protein HK105_205472 [Polyrhizophydium stewartii]|uniref:Uncharacterized protein n=1 Tax=Polyrhizophydium stewartii TaxID=2732419 RepID=A0ABR4N637_9FUNG
MDAGRAAPEDHAGGDGPPDAPPGQPRGGTGSLGAGPPPDSPPPPPPPPPPAAIQVFLDSSLPNPLKSELVSLRETLADAQRQNLAMASRLQAEAFERARLEAALSDTQNELVVSQKLLTELKYDPFSTLAVNAALQRKIGDMRIAMDSLEAENRHLKGAVASATAERLAAEQELLAKAAAVEALDAERAHMAEMIMEAQRAAADAARQLASADAESRTQKRRIAALESRLDAKQPGTAEPGKRCPSCGFDGEDAAAELASAGMRIADLTSELERVQQSSQQLAVTNATSLKQTKAERDLRIAAESTAASLSAENSVLMARSEGAAGQIEKYMALNEEQQRRLVANNSFLRDLAHTRLQESVESGRHMRQQFYEFSAFFKDILGLIWMLGSSLEAQRQQRVRMERSKQADAAEYVALLKELQQRSRRHEQRWKLLQPQSSDIAAVLEPLLKRATAANQAACEISTNALQKIVQLVMTVAQTSASEASETHATSALAQTSRLLFVEGRLAEAEAHLQAALDEQQRSADWLDLLNRKFPILEQHMASLHGDLVTYIDLAAKLESRQDHELNETELRDLLSRTQLKLQTAVEDNVELRLALIAMRSEIATNAAPSRTIHESEGDTAFVGTEAIQVSQAEQVYSDVQTDSQFVLVAHDKWSALEAELAQHSQRELDLAAEVAELSKSRGELDAAVAFLHAREAALLSELQQERSLRTDLEVQHKDLATQHKDLATQRADLETRITQLADASERPAVADSDVQTDSQFVLVAHDKWSALEAELAQHSQRELDLAAEVAELSKSRGELDAAVAFLHAREAALLSELQQERSLRTDLEVQHKDLATQHKDLATQRADLETRITQLADASERPAVADSDVQTDSQFVLVAHDKWSALEAELAQHSQRELDLAAEVAELSKSRGELDAAVAFLHAREAALLSELQQERSLRTDLEVQHKDLAAQHKDLATQHKDLAAQHKDLATQHKDLATQRANLETRITQLADSSKRPAVADSDAQTDSQFVLVAHDKWSALEAELAQHSQRELDLAAEVAELSKSRGELDAAVAFLHAREAALLSELQQERSLRTDLEVQHKDLATQHKDLATQRANLETRITQLADASKRPAVADSDAQTDSQFVLVAHDKWRALEAELAQHSQRELDLAAEVAELSKSRGELDAAVAFLHAREAALLSELQQERSLRTDLEVQHKDLATQHKDLATQRANLETRITQLADASKRPAVADSDAQTDSQFVLVAHDKWRALEAELAQHSQRELDLAAEVAELSKSRGELDAAVAFLHAREAALLSELQQERLLRTDLEVQHKDLATQHKDLATQRADLETRITQLADASERPALADSDSQTDSQFVLVARDKWSALEAELAQHSQRELDLAAEVAELSKSRGELDAAVAFLHAREAALLSELQQERLLRTDLEVQHKDLATQHKDLATQRANLETRITQLADASERPAVADSDAQTDSQFVLVAQDNWGALEAELAQHSQRELDLAAEVAELSKSRGELDAAVAFLHAREAALLSELQQERLLRTDLEVQHKDLATQHKDLATQRANLETRITQLADASERPAVADSDAQTDSQFVLVAQDNWGALEAELAQHSQRELDLAAEVAELSKSRGELDAAVAFLHAREAALLSELQQERLLRTDLEVQHKDLATQHKDLATQRANLETRITQLADACKRPAVADSDAQTDSQFVLVAQDNWGALEAELAQHSQRELDLAAEVAELSKSRGELDAAVAFLHAREAALLSELQRERSLRTDLEVQHKDLAAQHKDLATQHKDLATQRANLETRITQLADACKRPAVADSDAQTDSQFVLVAQDKWGALEAELAQHSQRELDLAAEVAELSKSRGELDAAVAFLHAREAALLSELQQERLLSTDLEVQHKDLATQHKDLATQRANLETRITQLADAGKRPAVADSDVQTDSQFVLVAQDKWRALEAELAQHSQRELDLAAEVAELSKSRGELDAAVAFLHAREAALLSELQQERLLRTDLEVQHKDLAAQHKDLATQHKDLAAQRANLETRITQLADASKRPAIADSDSQTDSQFVLVAHDKWRALEAELAQHSQRELDLAAEVAELSKSRGELDAAVAFLHAREAALLSELQQERSLRFEVEANSQQLVEQCEIAKASSTDLYKKLQMQTTVNNKLQTMLDQFESPTMQGTRQSKLQTDTEASDFAADEQRLQRVLDQRVAEMLEQTQQLSAISSSENLQLREELAQQRRQQLDALSKLVDELRKATERNKILHINLEFANKRLQDTKERLLAENHALREENERMRDSSLRIASDRSLSIREGAAVHRPSSADLGPSHKAIDTAMAVGLSASAGSSPTSSRSTSLSPSTMQSAQQLMRQFKGRILRDSHGLSVWLDTMGMGGEANHGPGFAKLVAMVRHIQMYFDILADLVDALSSISANAMAQSVLGGWVTELPTQKIAAHMGADPISLLPSTLFEADADGTPSEDGMTFESLSRLLFEIARETRNFEQHASHVRMLMQQGSTPDLDGHPHTAPSLAPGVESTTLAPFSRHPCAVSDPVESFDGRHEQLLNPPDALRDAPGAPLDDPHQSLTLASSAWMSFEPMRRLIFGMVKHLMRAVVKSRSEVRAKNRLIVELQRAVPAVAPAADMLLAPSPAEEHRHSPEPSFPEPSSTEVTEAATQTLEADSEPPIAAGDDATELIMRKLVQVQNDFAAVVGERDGLQHALKQHAEAARKRDDEMRDLREHAERLHAELHDMSRNRDYYEQRHAISLRELDELHELRRVASVQAADLQAAFESQQAEMEAAVQAIDDLRAQLAKQTDRAQALESSWMQADSQLQTCDARAVYFETLSAKRAEEAQMLHNQVQDLKDRVIELQQLLELRAAESDQQQAQLCALELELELARSALESLRVQTAVKPQNEQPNEQQTDQQTDHQNQLQIELPADIAAQQNPPVSLDALTSGSVVQPAPTCEHNHAANQEQIRKLAALSQAQADQLKEQKQRLALLDARNTLLQREMQAKQLGQQQAFDRILAERMDRIAEEHAHEVVELQTRVAEVEAAARQMEARCDEEVQARRTAESELVRLAALLDDAQASAAAAADQLGMAGALGDPERDELLHTIRMWREEAAEQQREYARLEDHLRRQIDEFRLSVQTQSRVRHGEATASRLVVVVEAYEAIITRAMAFCDKASAMHGACAHITQLRMLLSGMQTALETFALDQSSQTSDAEANLLAAVSKADWTPAALVAFDELHGKQAESLQGAEQPHAHSGQRDVDEEPHPTTVATPPSDLGGSVLPATADRDRQTLQMPLGSGKLASIDDGTASSAESLSDDEARTNTRWQLEARRKAEQDAALEHQLRQHELDLEHMRLLTQQSIATTADAIRLASRSYEASHSSPTLPSPRMRESPVPAASLWTRAAAPLVPVSLAGTASHARTAQSAETVDAAELDADMDYMRRMTQQSIATTADTVKGALQSQAAAQQRQEYTLALASARTALPKPPQAMGAVAAADAAGATAVASQGEVGTNGLGVSEEELKRMRSMTRLAMQSTAETIAAATTQLDSLRSGSIGRMRTDANSRGDTVQ